MKHLTTLLIGLLLLAGCAPTGSSFNWKHEIAVTKKNQKPELTDHDKVALLRAEAAKRGLKWTIWCIWWAAPDSPGFQGSAHRKGEPNDEQHDRWLIDGYTQGEVAYELYTAIQGDPTHPAASPEKEQKKYRRLCPPELSDSSKNEPCTDCKVVKERK